MALRKSGRIGLALGILGVLAGCGRRGDPAVRRRSVQAAQRHVGEARDAIDRLGNGLLQTLNGAANGFAVKLVPPIDAERVRNAVRDLRDDQTDVGRAMSLYPVSFLAAFGADGHVIARDLPQAEDLMRGLDLGALFPCVGRALQAGTPGLCVGEFPAVANQTSRVYLLAVAPVKRDGVQVVGGLAGGFSFGMLARSVRLTLDAREARARPNLRVALFRGARILPSGRDNDVAPMYRLPAPLIRRLPADRDARLERGGGAFTFSFEENDGEYQWGAAVGRILLLGNDAGVMIFRSEYRQ